MKIRLLAVMPTPGTYLPCYEVDTAHSFREAKQMILDAECTGRPYDTLELPVNRPWQFWGFVRWMETTGRRYPFSIFGYSGEKEFCKIAGIVRKKGFHFNS